MSEGKLGLETSIPDKLLALFRVIGIGRKEAKVYLTILTRGPITARDLALYLNVSPTKVYEPLNKLASLGLVVKTNDRPAKFMAVEPRIAWRRIKGMIEDNIRVFEEKLLPQIEALYHGSSGLYRIILVPGHDVLYRLIDVIVSSRTNIDLALSYRELITEQILKAIINASKHIKVRVLIDKKYSDFQELLTLRNEGVNIHVIDGMFGSGVIGSSVLLIVKTREGNLIGMWSDHEFFVEIAKVYFEHLWGKSYELIRS